LRDMELTPAITDVKITGYISVEGSLSPILRSYRLKASVRPLPGINSLITQSPSVREPSWAYGKVGQACPKIK
jgi:hypothetical protein